MTALRELDTTELATVEGGMMDREPQHNPKEGYGGGGGGGSGSFWAGFAIGVALAGLL